MKKLLIIGAGGHGRVVADAASSMNIYTEIAFLDDSLPSVMPPYPILGKVSDMKDFVSAYEMVVAIGDTYVRKQITEQLEAKGATLAAVVHSSAVCGHGVIVEPGAVVMAGTVLQSNTKIGKGAIVNTAATVDHDSVVGEYSHIAVGAHLCGTVQIGNHVWVGAGAVVVNNVEIKDQVVIGAGGAVIHSVLQPGTYVGTPVRKLRD